MNNAMSVYQEKYRDECHERESKVHASKISNQKNKKRSNDSSIKLMEKEYLNETTFLMTVLSGIKTDCYKATDFICSLIHISPSKAQVLAVYSNGKQAGHRRDRTLLQVASGTKV